MSKNKKPLLLSLDNESILIKRWDDNNVFVERKETYFNHKNKKQVTDYRFKGYYGNVFQALISVYTKGLLVNENEIKTVGNFVDQIEKGKLEILRQLKELKK